MEKYLLNESGEFIIENYNQAKPFASFFPGIAGTNGTPMWVFYVNRGQCLCSAGINDKDNPIMEFLSANSAYQLTSVQGFRTFIKLIHDGKTFFHEPFQDKLSQQTADITQRMIIRPESLLIEEENKELGLSFKVKYYNVVGENYPGLLRKLTIKNESKKRLKTEVLDGLPLIIPFGVDNYNLKHMRRLVESFVVTTNLVKKAPYFKIRTKQQDSPEVIEVRKGNFYSGFISNEQKAEIVPTIVDPQKIFASVTDYSYPKLFMNRTPYKLFKPQITENRLPCAMGYFSIEINPDESCTYNSIIGNTHSVEKLNEIVPQICRNDYFSKKDFENEAVIQKLTQGNFVQSSSNKFDLYCRQNFLDNLMRGGVPLLVQNEDKTTTVYLYSRKHGDLERDYNDFHLSATNYSQGNGHFRDVNQNRRNDIFFNPDVKTDNIEQFYNMIQLDGFNPLVVKPDNFEIESFNKLKQILKKAIPAESISSVAQLFEKPYTPGKITSYLTKHKIKTKISFRSFISEILVSSKKMSLPDYGDGFWSDHWIYNLDLLENYLAVWPEQWKYVLFEKDDFTFFDNPNYVLPRKDKYVIWEDKPIQVDSVAWNSEKDFLIDQRTQRKNEVRTEYGKGEIYHTNLIHKIINIIVNKITSLDFEGVGIEMEADKPNWYDALNGLPGLFGSSLCETLELKRLILFVLSILQKAKQEKIKNCFLAVETYKFLININELLDVHRKDKNDFEYWDKSTTLKELYRNQILSGVSGKEEKISISELESFLISAFDKLEHGISKAQAKSTDGVIPSYFINHPVEYDRIIINGKPKLNKRKLQCIEIKKFKQIDLPVFLEGNVHLLKTERDKNKAEMIAIAVRKSSLYDKKLKMYKVNASLLNQPMEIGRTRTFSRGWLENESIWMHMEYKYMLELLKAGLFDQFFSDFKNVLVPFMNPQTYGRSILENSSFIASGANPDASVHGNGFVARLSGATAEFISIFLIMAIGKTPFIVGNNNELLLRFKPAIPGWLFTTKHQTREIWINNKKVKKHFAAKTFNFMFLGDILVTYKNPKMKDTFGYNGVKPVAAEVTDIKGNTIKINSDVFGEEIASQAREHKIRLIEIELG